MPSYPERWEAEVVLSDGGTMAVRPIRPDDAERIVAFHERQSPESIYFRFFSPRPTLSSRDVERFTHVDYVDRMAFVALIGNELVGVARYDRHRARSDAEVAFFIDDEHHGRGMATVLLEYLAAAAREAGISGFTASVLPQNRKMLGVFTQAGFSTRSHFEEGVIEVELGIEPTPEALAAIEARAGTAEARSVQRLLRPSSIAVVGASRAPGTVGHQLFHQLVSRGFEGPVYPVNREATYVASVRAWRSVLDVPGELDLAMICVPAAEVLRTVEECAVKRVQGLVVLSSGFADRDEAGESAEAALVSYARRHGMRLIGPNALGIINTDPAVRLHATFVPVDPIPGPIGLVAQSGVIGAAIVDSARQLGLGISSFAAIGNKADVSSNDLLRYWQDDDATKVVMCYLESFGNPSKFSRIARDLSAVKPVVAVKVANPVTEPLGSVTSDAVFGGAGGADRPGGRNDGAGGDDWPAGTTAAALLDQAGIVRVDNLTQMLHTAGVLAHQPLPAGRRVAVLTNSWGPAWLACDALRASGLDPADPVDLSNEAAPERFGEALTTLYGTGEVDAVLVIYAPALVGHYRAVAAAITEAAATAKAVTTVACLLGEHSKGLLIGDGVRVPEFPFPEEAALALGRVADYAGWRAQPVGSAFELPDADRGRAGSLVATILAGARPGRSGSSSPPLRPRTPTPEEPGIKCWLDTMQAEQVLAVAGLDMVTQAVVASVDEAVAAATSIGYPVALKATGLGHLTKTEAGGVSLDVHGEDEVRGAYARMVEVLGDAMRPAIVQAMAAEGVECRIVLRRHPLLGDVVSLSAGGAAAEAVTRETAGEALRILPLTDADAERLIDASVVGPLLAVGYPPEAPEGETIDAASTTRADGASTGRGRAALVDLLCRLAALAEAIPEIAWVRLNPVLIHGDAAAITDARIVLATHHPDTRPPVRRL